MYEYLQLTRLTGTVENIKEVFNFTTITQSFICLGWLSAWLSNICKSWSQVWVSVSTSVSYKIFVKFSLVSWLTSYALLPREKKNTLMICEVFQVFVLQLERGKWVKICRSKRVVPKWATAAGPWPNNLGEMPNFKVHIRSFLWMWYSTN